MLRPSTWAPLARRDRTTEHRPPWHRVTDPAEFDRLAGLHPDTFQLVADICRSTGWTGVRGLALVLRAVSPPKGARRATTRRVRAQLRAALDGRLVDYRYHASLVEYL